MFPDVHYQRFLALGSFKIYLENSKPFNLAKYNNYA